MIYFVRYGCAFFVVDDFSYHDIALDPASIRQRMAKPLSKRGLPAPALDQLSVLNLHPHECIAQFTQRFGEVPGQHRQSVVLGLDVEARLFEVR